MKQVDLPTLSLYSVWLVQNIDQVAGTVSAPLRSILERDDKDGKNRNTSSAEDFWKSLVRQLATVLIASIERQTRGIE